jgi:hypothetical protein
MKDKTALSDSRKFRVLLLACVVYLLPVLLTFALVLAHLANKEDLFSLTKWMGASLSPAFLAFIGGVAIEDAASKQSNSGG